MTLNAYCLMSSCMLEDQHNLNVKQKRPKPNLGPKKAALLIAAVLQFSMLKKSLALILCRYSFLKTCILISYVKSNRQKKCETL